MSQHLRPEEFGDNARAALADDQLHGALQNVTGLFVKLRKDLLIFCIIGTVLGELQAGPGLLHSSVVPYLPSDDKVPNRQ